MKVHGVLSRARGSRYSSLTGDRRSISVISMPLLLDLFKINIVSLLRGQSSLVLPEVHNLLQLQDILVGFVLGYIILDRTNSGRVHQRILQ
jgi:hypothetical protein